MKYLFQLDVLLILVGFFTFFWVVPGIIFALSIALIHLKFLMTLPAAIRRLFLIAGATYILGAVGLEMVGGYYFDSFIRENLLTSSTWTNFSMAIILAMEELFEMLGILVFIYALMSYINLNLIDIEISFSERKRNIMSERNELKQRNFQDESR